MFQYLKTKIPPLLIVSFFILTIFLLRNLLGHFSFVYQDYISILFMIIYIICILYIKLEFKKHKTTISPSNPDNATSLVQSGFFRFSRNPIYFSLLNIIFCPISSDLSLKMEIVTTTATPNRRVPIYI